MFVLNISQAGDEDKTQGVLGEQRSMINSLLAAPWEASGVQWGDGSKTRQTLRLLRLGW